MIRAFVDRIETTDTERTLAVLLIRLPDGDYLQWLCPVEWLPPATREGDWLRVEFTQDRETQAKMRSEIESLLQELQGE
ncbi:MAG: DUF3006 domain-containing protein [Fimbriimonadales bacterium]|nr:DUF3006 domain-containing protein [Fimbriimonadales bacterium]